MKPLKLQQVEFEMLAFASQGLPYSHQKSIQQIMLLSKQLAGHPIIIVLCRLYANIFMSIEGPLKYPLGAQMKPKIDQVAAKN